MNEEGQAARGKPRRKLVRSSAYPAITVTEAVGVARAVDEAGGKLSDEALASALGFSPMTGKFKRRVAAAGYYGLVERKGGMTVVTPLGRRTVAPTEEGDDRVATAEAFEKPRLFEQLLGRFAGKNLPRASILENILRTEYGISPSAAPEAARMFTESGLAVARLVQDGEVVTVLGEGAAPEEPAGPSAAPSPPAPSPRAEPPMPATITTGPKIDVHIDISGWTPDQLLEFIEKLSSSPGHTAGQDGGATK